MLARVISKLNLFQPLTSLFFSHIVNMKESTAKIFAICHLKACTYSRVLREAMELAEAEAAEASSMLLLNTSSLPGGDEEAPKSAERVLLTACKKKK